MKKLLALLIKAKVDFDRSKAYWGYVQFIMMIYVTLRVSEDTVWGAWIFNHSWVIILLIVVMLWIMRRIGKFITKYIYPKELTEINKANPYFMEMYNKIMKMKL
ncbi:hypothetical protein LCGC14_1496990 [marine sediment metagenome]|uniref:Uncharacterized protein n=1 Tax=marine sediment metagenome TaxID=412755 RepID=A0A0F9JR40_9ZZZZ